MNKTIAIMAAALTLGGSLSQTEAQVNIQKNNITLQSDRMTPEALWAMGRIGGAQASPDGRRIAYQVGYYSVKENKGHQILYVMDADGKNIRQLTTDAKNETDAAWIEGGRLIAFLRDGQLWAMNADGTGRRQLTNDKTSRDSSFRPTDGTCSSSRASPTTAPSRPIPPTCRRLRAASSPT